MEWAKLILKGQARIFEIPAALTSDSFQLVANQNMTTAVGFPNPRSVYTPLPAQTSRFVQSREQSEQAEQEQENEQENVDERIKEQIIAETRRCVKQLQEQEKI